jgi:hypothetical protein
MTATTPATPSCTSSPQVAIGTRLNRRTTKFGGIWV